MRKFGVGLVEDGILEIGCFQPGFVHHAFAGFGDMLEICRVAGKALTVLRVAFVRPPPKIRRVGDVGVGGFDDRQRFFCRTQNVGSAACRGGVFQRIPWASLGGIHANCQGVASHPCPYHGNGCHHRLGARLAGKFPIASLDANRRADGFGDDR